MSYVEGGDLHTLCTCPTFVCYTSAPLSFESLTSAWTEAASVVWVVGAWRRSAERAEHFHCQDGDIGAGKRDKRYSINVHGKTSYTSTICEDVISQPPSMKRRLLFLWNCCVLAQRCASWRGSLLALACTAMWWIRQCLTLLAGRDWLTERRSFKLQPGICFNLLWY